MHNTTMNISLPDTLKSFVDEQVKERGFGSSSEYIRELIRKERDIAELRAKLLEGANSGIAEEANDAFFARRRRRNPERSSK